MTKYVKNFDRPLLVSPTILVGIIQNLMVFGSATSVRNFVKIDAQGGCLHAHLFCMVWCKEEKYLQNLVTFRYLPISQKLLEQFLSNLVCKVLYMV